MKLLFISSYLPYPLYSGGHIRLYNLIKLLSKKHEITLLCEKRPYQTNQDVKEVEKICKKVLFVKRKKQWSIENIIRSGLSSDAFLITGHSLNTFREIIKNELEENKYDLIHVETSYVMQNLPVSNTLPVVLVEHNIEYQVYERFMKKSPGILHPLLTIDINKLKVAERTFWKKADVVVTVSEQEKNVIGRSDTVVVPNGVDLTSFRFSEKNHSAISEKVKKLLFIGDFSWIQNRDTAEWIIKDIWPKIIDNVQHSTLNFQLNLWIVGKKIPENIKKYRSSTIIIDEGSGKSTPEIFQEADLLLSPIRVGGGTSYKILESMASGTPVVTTILGNEGIDAVDGKEILLADIATELAEKVVEVLCNKQLFDKIALGGRKVVEEKFNWEHIAKILDKTYSSVIQKK